MGMASMSTLSAPALAQSASAADGEEEILVTGNRLVSEREREVLGYTLRGYSASRTAARLGISQGTVKNHRKSIHRKLEINSRLNCYPSFCTSCPMQTVSHHLTVWLLTIAR